MREAEDTPVPPAHLNDVPFRTRASNYPQPFAERVSGRSKQVLGHLFGLRNLGVNLTTLAPGAISALHHRHSRQDEFICVKSGQLVLVLGEDEHVMTQGMIVGFPAGQCAHHLRNDTDSPASYLKIGDCSADDAVVYPNDDLAAVLVDRRWRFTRRSGEPYPPRDD